MSLVIVYVWGGEGGDWPPQHEAYLEIVEGGDADGPLSC